MKKLLFIALLSAQFIQAQESGDSPMPEGKSEVRVDLLTIALESKLNISYEYFLNRNYSVGIFLASSNSNKINDDFDSGYRNTVPKYEISPFVRYNLSKSQKSFYFAEVFASANGGDFKETVRKIDGEGNGFYVNEKSSYSDVALGAGLGYKLYIKEKFGIEFHVGFGSNLFNRDKSPDTLSRVGLALGYRF